MAKKKKGVFEADRRMELRLRLAAKRAAEPAYSSAASSLAIDIPEKEILDRLIMRVKRL